MPKILVALNDEENNSFSDGAADHNQKGRAAGKYSEEANSDEKYVCDVNVSVEKDLRVSEKSNSDKKNPANCKKRDNLKKSNNSKTVPDRIINLDKPDAQHKQKISKLHALNLWKFIDFCINILVININHHNCYYFIFQKTKSLNLKILGHL